MGNVIFFSVLNLALASLKMHFFFKQPYSYAIASSLTALWLLTSSKWKSKISVRLRVKNGRDLLRKKGFKGFRKRTSVLQVYVRSTSLLSTVKSSPFGN